jgi:hypothetical protein
MNDERVRGQKTEGGLTVDEPVPRVNFCKKGSMPMQECRRRQVRSILLGLGFGREELFDDPAVAGLRFAQGRSKGRFKD